MLLVEPAGLIKYETMLLSRKRAVKTACFDVTKRAHLQLVSFRVERHARQMYFGVGQGLKLMH